MTVGNNHHRNWWSLCIVIFAMALSTRDAPTTTMAYATIAASSSRRAFLASATAAVTATTVTAAAPSINIANALDMDAFAQGELDKDAKAAKARQPLSPDAGLCLYGFPSPATGQACLRAGLPTTRTAGGVDAFGKVNRGDFVRCQNVYQEDSKTTYGYLKTTVCDGPRYDTR